MRSAFSAFVWMACASLSSTLFACGDLTIGGVPGEAGANSEAGGAGAGSEAGSVNGGEGGAPGLDGATPPPPLVTNPPDKLDIIFDIDNSSSMGDKQALLGQAIPDLVNRLINPNCVDANNNAMGPSIDGVCAEPGLVAEFPPFHDIHLGILSSSLGARGGDLCLPSQMTNGGHPFADGEPSISSHTDDQAHLLGRSSTGTGTAVSETEALSPDVGDQDFLDWFPASSDTNDPIAFVGTPALSPKAKVLTKEGALGTSDTLEGDFGNLVAGVHAFGCEIESQLESWYRFLIQPDPYSSIAVQGGKAVWQGYDATILQQRHDFLRPDSIVLIAVLSDENDSEIDVRSLGGTGYQFMQSSFNPPRGTAACATSPASKACMPCTSSAAPAGDASCALGPYASPVDWGKDANLRHVHMKQKYGVDPQYPIERYYLGLTSLKVPDRDHEYPVGADSYQGGTSDDPSNLDCTNPLFAPPLADGSTSLPDGTDLSPSTLCNTAHAANIASRPAAHVFFAHIGGVPFQLLQTAPGTVDPSTGQALCAAATNQADCPQKDTLAPADWLRILGNGAAASTPTSPPSYDYTGIDPHMIEDYTPRASLSASAALPAGGGADPISGREWVTNTSTSSGGAPVPTHVNLPVDLEYACVFPLEDPVTGAPTPRDCSNSASTTSGGDADFLDQDACECSTTGLSATAPSAIPAVCGQCSAGSCSQGGTDYNLQYYAKAYPSIREAELAHLMGGQGILSSMCPIHTHYANQDASDPVYGYRPATTSIINRLKTVLNVCLAERLTPVAGSCANHKATDECVPCLVLVTYSPTDTNTCEFYGFTAPTEQEMANYRQQQGAAATGGTVCVVPQIPYISFASCGGKTTKGWCYVMGVAAGAGCTEINEPQTIDFGNETLPHGSTVSLQCVGQP